MDLSQLNLGTVALAVCGLAVLGGVLFLLVQGIGLISALIGVIAGLFTALIDLIAGVISGGPVLWCGCLAALAAGGGCLLLAALTISLISACGTPQASNFCTLLGR